MQMVIAHDAREWSLIELEKFIRFGMRPQMLGEFRVAFVHPVTSENYCVELFAPDANRAFVWASTFCGGGLRGMKAEYTAELLRDLTPGKDAE